jgi:hypothetical protein
MAAVHAARDLTWIIQLAQQWHIPLLELISNHRGPYDTPRPTTRFELRFDNKNAIYMASASGPTKRTKHIDVKHHYIQQQIKSNILTLVQVPSSEQKADIFTKALPRVQFLHNLSQLSIPSMIEGGC